MVHPVRQFPELVRHFKDWPEMVGNIIPYIGGEEEKSEKEPLRIWGHVDAEKKAIVPGNHRDHLPVSVFGIKRDIQRQYFVKLKNPTKEADQGIENFGGVCRRLGLQVRKAVHPVLRKTTGRFLRC